MGLKPELQNAVDKELAYLKSFNNNYLDESLDFYLEDKESHIKPIIEAIALLSSRTQLSGRQQIDLLHQRLIKQFMSYLVTPVPAMGLVKINVDKLIEPTTIPAGTALTLSTYDGRESQFKSLFDIPLRSVALRNTGVANKLGENSKLVLQLEALNDYPGKLDKLQLCLYGQGNYQTTIHLKKLLQTDCLKVEAIFNNGATLDYDIDFSEPPSSVNNNATHPITKERQFFQLPHKNSFISIHVKDSKNLPKQWKSCQLVFTLNCTWPSNLLLDNELIQLFISPVENRILAHTDPIFYNGTRNQYRIIAPSISPEMQICSIKGVYQIKEGEHIPLHSSVLVDTQNTYEISYPQEDFDNARQYPLLVLNMPEAFDTPVKIMTDAYWHEPEFSKAITQTIRVYPADLELTGIQWSLINTSGKKFLPYHPAATLSSAQLLELAALKNKPILTLQELLFITYALSTVWHGEFKVLKPFIQELDVAHEYQTNHQSHNGQSSNATDKLPILRYTLSFSDFDPQLNPLADNLLEHLEKLLEYWISHHEIRFIANYANTLLDVENHQARTKSATETHYDY